MANRTVFITTAEFDDERTAFHFQDSTDHVQGNGRMTVLAIAAVFQC